MGLKAFIEEEDPNVCGRTQGKKRRADIKVDTPYGTLKGHSATDQFAEGLPNGNPPGIQCFAGISGGDPCFAGFGLAVPCEVPDHIVDQQHQRRDPGPGLGALLQQVGGRGGTAGGVVRRRRRRRGRQGGARLHRSPYVDVFLQLQKPRSVCVQSLDD